MIKCQLDIIFIAEVRMKTIYGNLVTLTQEGQFDILIHGCNCFTTMGGGIAREIRDTWPGAYRADCATKKGDRSKLGTYSQYKTQSKSGSTITIINAYTQFKYWKEQDEDPITPIVDYAAVRQVLINIKRDYGGRKFKFGIPKIGAGLALGDWNILEKIIIAELRDEDVTLVLLPENT